jgi:hypothetical protein
MARNCSVCRHDKREEIDRALLAQVPFRHVAACFSISATAAFRHSKSHIPAALMKAKQAADEVKADTLFDRLREINREARAILEEARGAGSKDNDLALKAIARIEKQLELEARLLGELDESTKIAVGVNVTSPPAKHDLSVLSNDELQVMVGLLKKTSTQLL